TREEREYSLDAGADLTGAKNRDLKTFKISLDVSKELAPPVPDSVVKGSERGIEPPKTRKGRRSYGYQGIQNGQECMQQGSAAKACKKFIDELRRRERQKVQ